MLGLLFKTQEAVNFYEVVISPKMKYYISIKGGRCKTRRIIKYMIKDLDRQISRIDKMLNL